MHVKFEPKAAKVVVEPGEEEEEKIYSWSEVLKKEGVYMPVSDSDGDHCRLISVYGRVIYTHNSGVVARAEPKVWKHHKFIKTNETVVIND